jgi:hypothetical protein
MRSNIEGYNVSHTPTLLMSQNETNRLAVFFSHETQRTRHPQVMRKLVTGICDLSRKAGLVESPKLLEVFGPIFSYFGHSEPAKQAFPDE